MTHENLTQPARPWRTAVLAGMASYLDAAAIVTTGIALVLYRDPLGIDELNLGLLSGLLTFMFALGAIIGGRLGDRFGRRRVFSITLVVYAVGVLLLATAPPVFALPLLYAGVLLTGFSIGADLPVSLALIAEAAPAGKKGRMIIFSGLLWLAGILTTLVLSIAVAPLGELGARIMFGHLLLVAIAVLVGRSTLRESAEWTAARAVTTADDARIDFARVSALFAPPIVITAIATGLYYAIWNLGANTFGQFGTLIFTTIGGTDVQTASMISLFTFPIGLVGGLVFMRIVDKPKARGIIVALASAVNVIAFAMPLLLGPSVLSLGLLIALFGVGAAFAGEAMYKVWSQELFPTLLRSSAQGITLAFARIVAALFAFVTPTFIASAPATLFLILFGCAIVSGVIGVFWIPRLPKASQLESVPADDRAVSAG
jgi:inositol transporter-like SP family MFS transporter